MPKVNFVQAARKTNPVANIGESYYWWKCYEGPKQFSKTPPKQSQLTRSAYKSSALSIMEEIEGFKQEDFASFEDLKTRIEELSETIRELGEEQQESLDNMPHQLQDAPIGEMLQERISACDCFADELDDLANNEPEEDESDFVAVGRVLDELQQLSMDVE